jgi:hypothetical protein
LFFCLSNFLASFFLPKTQKMADALLELIDSLASPPGSPHSKNKKTVEKQASFQKEASLHKSISRKLSTSKESIHLDWVELLQRPSEQPLQERERIHLYTYLLSLTKEALHEIQLKSRPFTLSQKESGLFDLEVDHYGIIFQHEAQVQERQVNLKWKTGVASAKFHVYIPPNDGSYQLTVDPIKGKVLWNYPKFSRFHKGNLYRSISSWNSRDPNQANL